MSLVEALARPTRLATGRRGGPSAIWIPALIVGAAVLIPLIYIGVRAAEADADAWGDLFSGSTARLLGNTVALAAAVTGASAALALPMAWLTERTDLPARRFWRVLTVLPLVVPSYVGGLAMVAAFGPRGSLHEVLGPLGVESLPQLYGFAGAWLALTLFTYPYMLLVVRAGMRHMDPGLEDASRALGYGPFLTFLRVTLPQLRVPIAAGGLLVSLYVVSDFGAVSMLRFDTFTRAIFVQFQSTFDRAATAVLSLALVALVVVILAAEWRAGSRGRFHRLGAGAAAQPRIVRLRRWRWPSLAFLSLIMLVALGAPIAVLLDWVVRGLNAGDPFSGVWGAVGNSLLVATLAAAIAVAASLPIAIVAVRHASPLATLIERASHVGFALPGVVVALSMIFFALRVVPGLYQTLGVLVFAYLVLFLPQAVSAVRSSLVRVGPNLEDAARGLGRSPVGVLRSITIPLVTPGIVGGFALVFLTAMKELPATLLLAPIEFDTLATRVWGSYQDAFFAQAAAPALLLLVFAAIPMAVLVGRQPELRD